MKMKTEIDPDALLDSVELQIFPSQNRYEAYVCSSNRTQKVTSGTLKQLLLHSPQVKDLSSKGSNTNFKILPPDNPSDADWFTTTTLTRFLHIIDSPDILSIGNEITQLEETRKFQLSLTVEGEVDVTSSINSKNELLRAVDLRLTALKDELALAFDKATGAKCSTKDISDLENFSHHFGSKDIRDSLQKFAEMSLFPSPQPKDKKAPDDFSNSSVSSEENQPSIERSRAPNRSATPRRSASPMRRIQIGRSGSHRAAALTIKSLNYFPPREKLGFQRDASSNSSDEEEEGMEKSKKKNVLRMSVQDKISLFENKQRDQSVNVSKSRVTLNPTTKKGVLRRWSSGMGENRATDNNDNNTTNHNTETTPIVAQEVESSNIEPETEESCEKHVDSIEWSQQKEAELNQLFTEMMENKAVKPRRLTSDVSNSKNSDEKLQWETTGKRAEKEAQFKVTKRFIDENKPVRSQRKSTPLINYKKESVLKKATTKTSPSPLPTTRKSWPSTQPLKAKEESPSRTSRKPLSTSSDVRSSTKSEKSKPRSTTPKSTPPPDVANRNPKKTINEKKQAIVTKTKKSTKEAVNALEAKPSFYNKVTKKNSVVPLETKPFLRKGSGIKAKEKREVVEVVVTADVPEAEKAEVVVSEEHVSPERVELSEVKQELMISPTAWVEEEEENNYEEEEIVPCPVLTESPVKAVVTGGVTSPRVRQSLSQMLLEDASEGDVGEWGNAEVPPALVYQKESPKGFKRLLKTTKARRSFFSLSTFRGSKTNA